MSFAASDLWESFFRRCELPSSVCRKYAQQFVKERIQPYMLKDLKKEELRELGIDALGDQLSILRYVKSSDNVLQEFKRIGKNRGLSGEREDYIDMEMQLQPVFPAQDYKLKTVKVIGGQNLSLHSKANKKHAVRFSDVDTKQRIADQSRVIRKKPVMIHDISSSSPNSSSIGLMRSDAISLKTIIVDSPTPKRNLGLRFNKHAASPLVANRRQSPDFQICLNRNFENFKDYFDASDDHNEDYHCKDDLIDSSQLFVKGSRNFIGASKQFQHRQTAPAWRVLTNTLPSVTTRPITSRISARTKVINNASGRRIALHPNNVVSRRSIKEKPLIQSRLQRNPGDLVTSAQRGDNNGILNRISIVSKR